MQPLLDALCDETITPEQMKRLEELIRTYPEVEAYYVQYMSFYADLIHQFSTLPDRAEKSVRDRAVPTPLADATSSPIAPAPSAPTDGTSTADAPSKTSKRASRRFRPLLWGAIGMSGLAAGLLLGLFLGVGSRSNNVFPTRSAEPTDDTVAVLLQTNRAEWEETGMPTRAGAPLPPGRLVLKSGHAQIEFYSGATVILEGPAELQLVSRNRAYCARGKLRAHVPPHAQGFALDSPNLNLIDQGTEFGLAIGSAKTEVHVFEGKVQLYEPGADPKAPPQKELTTGQALSMADAGATTPMAPNSAAFLTADELADRTAIDLASRQAEWTAASKLLRRDPSLVVYYPFETVGARLLKDEARERRTPRDGAIVGCSWGTGRWAGKHGLEFKRVSDRVRIHVPGEYRSLTLAAWVRPDALPNVNHSLMMADGWEEGEPHWQIGSDGTIILGIKGPPDYKPEPNVRGPQYRAFKVITPERFGRWTHLAVVYDVDAGEVVHYVDGLPVERIAIILDLTLRIGDAEIGNWNAGSFKTKSPMRNFNGCMDEFLLFSRALRDDEIRTLCSQGRPPL